MKWWRKGGGVREVVTLLVDRVDARRSLVGGEDGKE
jgi:hypothetical protein